MGELRVADATTVVVGRAVADLGTVLGAFRPGVVGVITQPGVPLAIAESLAAEAVASGLAAGVLLIPDGERAKTLALVEDLCRRLADMGMDRSGAVVGVGGGAATDLAGFVAAVYLRGVAAHYVPTTLLGAVDASIGGKTGVNLKAKNQVGLFRHPERVVIDVDVLDALEPSLAVEGLAEALKAGLIGDPRLVDLLEGAGPQADLEEVVTRALAVKASIVGSDFMDRGERNHLNYGHTIGHAIEVAGGLSHGRAIAVGMVAAGRISAEVAGFAEERRQTEIIRSLGLPISAPGVPADDIVELMGRDKKRAGGALRFVVLEAIGRPRVTEVDPTTVRAALSVIGI
jgi:3-dehydroquinate synthase